MASTPICRVAASRSALAGSSGLPVPSDSAASSSVAADELFQRQLDELKVIQAWFARLGQTLSPYLDGVDPARPPLTGADVEAARRLLYLAQAELLDAFIGLDGPELNRYLPGEERSINDILRHVATGENWYLDRLGLAHEPAWEMADTLGRLLLVRQHLLDVLPHLIADERVVMANGELWSPRKIIRRALWHQREHAAQVGRLRARLREERRRA